MVSLSGYIKKIPIIPIFHPLSEQLHKTGNKKNEKEKKVAAVYDVMC